jgi:hypothetical protein
VYNKYMEKKKKTPTLEVKVKEKVSISEEVK